MISSFKFPFYAKLALTFVAIYLFVDMLYLGKAIILPIIYGAIISILLNPIVEFLVRKRISRIVAITIAIVLAIVFVGGLIFLLANQFSTFADAFPKMEAKLNLMFKQMAEWVSTTFKINPTKANEWMLKTKTELAGNANKFIGKTIITISGLLIVIFLVPVYVFLLLYYQPLLLEFLRKLFARNHQEKLADVLLQSKTIVQSYLVGLSIKTLIVAILNVIALLIIGIDYAILLGITGALINIIPFVGGFLSMALPVFVALVTKDSYAYILLVIAAYTVIQFVEGNYIIPKIVASKVKVNALIAVIVVFIGDALWDIPGMILSIPLTGIIKAIFEYIDPLKPWAFLLGENMPPLNKKFFLSFRKNKLKNKI